MKAKLIALLIVILALVSMGFMLKVQSNMISSLKTEVIVANNNYDALENEYSNLKDKNITFELSIEQLNNSKDSLIREMNKLRNSLKIKDKEIKELSYLSSLSETHDSIFITNTIKVIEPIDTTISDKWHSVNIQIDSTQLNVNSSFNNELYIFTYLRKETKNPSKCKMLNMFKKKTKILEVEVLENNPYVTNKKEKFIKLL